MTLKIRYKHVREYPPLTIKLYREDYDLDSDMTIITPSIDHWPPSPLGGKTVCSIFDEDGERVGYGVAWCGPRDRYVKKIGRDISYGRAVRSMVESDFNSLRRILIRAEDSPC